MKGIQFDSELEKAICHCQDLASHKAQDDYLGKQFCEDMAMSTAAPGAPHEAMSALIGLELCEKFNADIDQEFFARCIIGVKYLQKLKLDQEEMALRNAVISLLNGALIDVDKLDYTIRDSYVTGYNNLSIDLDRILAGYTLFRKNGEYQTGYTKGSLSVIENVIYANDLERRWIQNHPAIQYDNQLVDFLLGRFDSHMRREYMLVRKKSLEKNHSNTEGIPDNIATVFTKQSLSQEGMPGLQSPLKLLNDADILAYIKNVDDSEVSRQYLNRAKRFKPLWKTEAAFTPLSKDLGSDLMRDILNDFNEFLNTLQERSEPFINQEALDYLKNLVSEGKKYQRAVHICHIFKKFQEEANLPEFQFVLALTKRFRSNYWKISSQSEPIMVELESGYFPLEEVMSVQAKQTSQNMSKEFFYVYTTQENIQAQENLGIKFFDCLRRYYCRAE